MRNCGCNNKGRHRRTCKMHIQTKQKEEVNTIGNIHETHSESNSEKQSLSNLYIQAYGKTPHVKWYPNKTRQSTIENRIKRYVKRFKAFYITTTSLDKDSDNTETWYVDGGNWAFKKELNEYNILVGHVKNCLPFLGGRRPLWKKRRVK